MGDETIGFASRFALAVTLLDELATERGQAALRRRHGPGLAAAVADALDAVAAVHETRTEAVKDWAERRAKVLAAISGVRAALSRDGVDAEVRRRARALVLLVGPGGGA